MVDHTDDDGLVERPFRLRRRSRLLSRRLSRRTRRLCLGLVTFVISIALFGAAALGILSVRLSHGPVAVPGIEEPVTAALSARLGPQFRVKLGGIDIEAITDHPAVAVKRLFIQDLDGRTIVEAPRAVISLNPLSLLMGTVAPTRIDLQDLTLKLAILPDGSAALSAGSDDVTPIRIGDLLSTPASEKSASLSSTAAPPATPQRRDSETLVHTLATALAGIIDRFADVDNALSGFDQLGISNGTLIFDDRSRGSTTSFGNLDLSFVKMPEGFSSMSISADGTAGRWALSVQGSRYSDARRALSVSVNNLDIDDLRMVPGLRDPGFDTDMPISANAAFGLDEHGALAVARGHLALGSGFFRIHDPDHEPMQVSDVEATFRFDPSAGRIEIERSTIDVDASHYELTGAVTPPDSGDTTWAASLAGQGIFGAERPNEKPIKLDRINIAALVKPDEHRLIVDRFDVTGPQVGLHLQMEARHNDGGLLLQGTVASGKMPASIMLRLWPTPISAEVRSWLLVNLQSGVVERGKITFALTDADLARMRIQRSVADDHLRVDYAISDATLSFMAGVPPVRGVDGIGFVTGDTARFTVKRGLVDVSAGHQLALVDGALLVPSTDPKPAPATITAHVVGGIDVLTELLSRDALKPYANLPPDLGTPRGNIDGTLSVGLKLGRGASPDDVKIGASARIDNLAVDNIVGKQDLTGGSLSLVLDKTGLRLKGDAKLFDAPTAIDLKKPSGTQPGEATAVLTLDEAARIKAGMNFGKALTGPITAKVTTLLNGTDRKASVDLDLTKAAINNLVPGLSKAAGRPARVTLTAAPKDNGVLLDNIACDIGTFSARGTASLDGSGGFQAVHLTQARLSSGDDMRIDAQQSGEGLKLTVRGTNIDARPFLKSFTAPEGDASPDPTAKDIDLDLRTNVLTGQNSQALTGVELHVTKHAGAVKRLQVSGKFGRAPFTITSSTPGGVLTLHAVSGDAGATLAFLDLYKKVNNGELESVIHVGDSRLDGQATIHQFTLREDPAMKQLTEEGVAQDKSGKAQIDGSNIAFSKLFVVFSKTGSRVDIRDGGMFGQQMGATVQGSIDLARDKLQLTGTYVPAYGVNNLFSQIPVLGTILGGGAHEGLFGINYRISGSVASPNLSVDPLSALAPGILRKIFGAISDATEEQGAPTLTKPGLDRAAR